MGCWWPCCGEKILVICHGRLQTTAATGTVTRLDADTGAVQWTADLGTGVSSISRRAVNAAIDSQGNIYVVSDLGGLGSRLAQQGTGTSLLITTTAPVCSLSKLDSSGSVLWTADMPNRKKSGGNALESFITENKYLPNVIIDDDDNPWVGGSTDVNGDCIWQCDPADGSVSLALGRTSSYSFGTWPAASGRALIETPSTGSDLNQARLRLDNNGKIVVREIQNLSLFRMDTSGAVEYSTNWDTDNAISGISGASPKPQYNDVAYSDIFVDTLGRVFASNIVRHQYNNCALYGTWTATKPIWSDWYNANYTDRTDRALLDDYTATPYNQFLRKFGPLSGGSGYELDELYKLTWRATLPQFSPLVEANVSLPITPPYAWDWGTARTLQTPSNSASLAVNGDYVGLTHANAILYERWEFAAANWAVSADVPNRSEWNVFAVESASNGLASWVYLFGHDSPGSNLQERTAGVALDIEPAGSDFVIVGTATGGTGGLSLVERITAGGGVRVWQARLSATGNTNAGTAVATNAAYRQV